MERLTDKDTNKVCFDTWELCGLDAVCKRDCHKPTPCKIPKIIRRLAELEDKLESGLLVDTTPYIVENKNDIPFKYKVIKPTLHRRNVEMCDSKESAEACLKKLEVKYANKTRKQESLSRELETDSFRNLKACKQSV